MEQRDQGKDVPEPEPLAEDIGRAAAMASAEAASEPMPEDLATTVDLTIGGDPADGFHSPHSAPYDTPAPRGPRRWLVTAGVAVSALALAGTAAAIATSSSHGSGDTTENTAAARTADSPTGADTPQSAGTSASSDAVDRTADGDGSSTTQNSSTTSSSSSPSPNKSSTTSKASASKTTAPAAPAGTDEEGGDCENTSHSTSQDDAVKFSGMTKGARTAFLAAQNAAKAEGLSFVLNSGYRSAAYQERIFECWVKELGSAQAARKYALPPSESAHVMGYAMDIAPPSAASWLEGTKGEFGLCRRYADETWHFEYQATYKVKGCPALLPHP